MSAQDLLPLLFAIAMGGVALIFRLRFGSILNPPTVHALAFLGQLVMYAFMQTYAGTEEFHFDVLTSTTNITGAYLLASVCFALPWLTVRKVDGFLKIDSLNPSVRDLRSIRLVLLLEILALGMVLLLCFGLMGLPLAAMLAGNLDVQQMQENAESLPAGLLAINLWLGILLSLQLSSAITFRDHYRLNGWQLSIITATIIFSAIWQAKRQVLLILLVFMSLFLMADRGRRNRMLRVAIGICVAFLAFLIIYMSVQYVRIGDRGQDIYYLELVLSGMWPLINLDRVMASTESVGQLYSLVSQLIPHRLFGHGYEGFVDVLFEPTSSVSYVLYAYYDFGYLGIAGAALFLGTLTLWVSYLFGVSVTGLQIRALVLWVCVSSPFYSHGFSLNYFLVPVLLLFFLRASLGGRRYVRSAIQAS